MAAYGVAPSTCIWLRVSLIHSIHKQISVYSYVPLIHNLYAIATYSYYMHKYTNMPIIYINTKCHLKSSRTCLVGYSGFVSHEWFFIAGDGWTYTHITHASRHEPGLTAEFAVTSSEFFGPTFNLEKNFVFKILFEQS